MSKQWLRQSIAYLIPQPCDRCRGGSTADRRAEDVAGIGDDAGGFPRQEHLSIFGDLVLALLRPNEAVRVDVPARACFSMNLGMRWHSAWMTKVSLCPSTSRNWIRRSRIGSQS